MFPFLGVWDQNLVSLKIGTVSHSRWLNTGTMICRIWISKHGIKSRKVLKYLKQIMENIIGVYFPLYFYIKVCIFSELIHIPVSSANVSFLCSVMS